jgi:hypothetical protein
VAGVRVWYDEFTIEWGDSLRQAIDRGLVNSRYGIVILSPSFLRRRRWTEHELDGLFARESEGNKVILPIWHNIKQEDLLAYGPALADRIAKNSRTDAIEEIVKEVQSMLLRSDPRMDASNPAKVKDWQDDVEMYAAHVVQVGGPGSRVTTRTAWMMTEHGYLDAERFVFVGFNGGGDIMSASPKEGYEITSSFSPSGNQIINDDYDKWCRILLEEKLKNEIVIQCRKTRNMT